MADSVSRARLASAVVLAVVFGAGALVGAAVDRTVLGTAVAADGPARDDDRGEEGSDDRRRRYLYQRMDGLSASQLERLDAVASRYEARMSEIRADFDAEFDPLYESLRRDVLERYEPLYDALVDETRAKMKELMTPEQQRQYDSLRADSRLRREERRRRRDEESDTTRR